MSLMFSFREEVEQLEEEVENRNLAMADLLREELNKLSGNQIHLQAQRLQMENQVGVEQACTDKGEEDFRAAQESKAAQDKFIQSLSEEVEQLEGLASQYAAQMAAMDQGTEETMGNVRRAEVQNLMEVGNKLRAMLLTASGGEDTSPLGQEIRF